jgi:uncharacterized protein
MKFLIWAAIAAIVVFWLMRPARRVGNPGATSQPRPPGPAPAGGVETMLCCAHCGTHIPASEAIVVAGAVFCCEEHRAARRTSR